MGTPRFFAASIVVDDKLWITGGREEKKKNYNSSTEFVDPKHPNTFFKGPDLPFDRIEQHCLARLSSHQVMLTGGTTGEIINNELQIIDYESAKTFVYDFLKNTWTSTAVLVSKCI